MRVHSALIVRMREEGYVLMSDLSLRWGLTSKAASAMRRKGRLPGCVRRSGVWFAPDSSERPAPDYARVRLRAKNGLYLAGERETRPEPVPLEVEWASWRPWGHRRSFGWFGAAS